MQSFENRRVVVTGSGRGIGKGIARRFAEGGAKVLLVARSRDELDQTRRELLELTSDVRALALDLTVPGAALQVIDAAAGAWGGLDILIPNAGAAPQGGFLDLEDNAWPAGFGLKMFANLRVIRHAWPSLVKSAGHLVMIGGGTARTPDRRLSLVSAVNGGIAALSKSIAEQGVRDGVHVNLVQPGTVRTQRRQRLFEKWAGEEGIEVEEYINRAALQLGVTRLGEPRDVAGVVAFLCSEESRWMQGSIVDVDGGQNKGV